MESRKRDEKLKERTEKENREQRLSYADKKQNVGPNT